MKGKRRACQTLNLRGDTSSQRPLQKKNTTRALGRAFFPAKHQLGANREHVGEEQPAAPNRKGPLGSHWGPEQQLQNQAKPVPLKRDWEQHSQAEKGGKT